MAAKGRLTVFSWIMGALDYAAVDEILWIAVSSVAPGNGLAI